MSTSPAAPAASPEPPSTPETLPPFAPLPITRLVTEHVCLASRCPLATAAHLGVVFGERARILRKSNDGSTVFVSFGGAVIELNLHKKNLPPKYNHIAIGNQTPSEYDHANEFLAHSDVEKIDSYDDPTPETGLRWTMYRLTGNVGLQVIWRGTAL